MRPISHDPRAVAAASLGQAALVASAGPDAFPNLVALAEHQLMTVTVAVIAVIGVSLLLGQLSAKPALRLRKAVVALIATPQPPRMKPSGR